MFRVSWKNGDKFGHGEYTSFYMAKLWVDHCNEKYPNIQHWVEEMLSF